MSAVARISKQGGRRYSSVGSSPSLGAMRLGSVGNAVVGIAIFPAIATLSQTGIEQATLAGTSFQQSTLSGGGVQKSTLTKRTS